MGSSRPPIRLVQKRHLVLRSCNQSGAAADGFANCSASDTRDIGAVTCDSSVRAAAGARDRAIARLARGRLWAPHSWGADPCEPLHGSAAAAAAAAAGTLPACDLPTVRGASSPDDIPAVLAGSSQLSFAGCWNICRDRRRRVSCASDKAGRAAMADGRRVQPVCPQAAGHGRRRAARR